MKIVIDITIGGDTTTIEGRTETSVSDGMIVTTLAGLQKTVRRLTEKALSQYVEEHWG